MLHYLLRRTYQLVPLLLVISAFIYLLLYLMPGDPLYRMLEDVPNLRPQDYERLRKIYGLDDPVYIQYWKWLWQLILLNPGYSREYGQPVIEIILPALKNTLVLTISAVVIGKVLAILLGIFSAVRQYSIGDYILTAVTFISYSVPAFWLGLMLIILFSVKLGWLPTSGIADSNLVAGSWEAWWDYLKHMILPVAVLAISEIIQVQRFMRSSLLEVLRQEYILTARSKGLNEWLVVSRHALRNAAIPILTIGGLQFGLLLGGAILTETIFSWPGIGKWMVDSIFKRDYVVVQSGLLLIALIVMAVNLIVDVLYAVINPRIRVS